MAVLKSHNGYFLYHYIPTIVGAAIFAAIFAIITLLHAWKMYKTRAWFCCVFIIGGLFEVIGYGARCASHSDTSKLIPYIIQSLLLLVAPALFAASVYMTLGRTIVAVRGEKYSPVRVRWLTTTFVCGDVFTFLVQGSGAGLLARGGDPGMGEKIIIGGLILQIIIFGIYVVCSFVFHRRMSKNPTTESFNANVPWRKMIWTLYAVSTLIMVRSIFRVVEYAMGQNGYPLLHEWTLYIFDALLMFTAMVIFFVSHPGHLRPYPKDEEALSMEPTTSNTMAEQPKA